MRKMRKFSAGNVWVQKWVTPDRAMPKPGSGFGTLGMVPMGMLDRDFLKVIGTG